jgi:hypothetical protein
MGGNNIALQFTNQLLNDDRKLTDANLEVNRIAEQIRGGYSIKNAHFDPRYSDVRDFIFSVARSRIRVEDKFSLFDRIWLDEYSASYSTPEIIGKYRAGRVRSRKIIDFGSGACMQAIMFSEHNDVTAIEEDPLRANLGRLNAKAYSCRNLRIVTGDVNTYISKPEQDDITVFSDPLRLSGREEKTFETLRPNPLSIIRDLGSRVSGYVIDLPPLFPEKNIKLTGEREYISLNGRISRFSLYSEDLSRCERSAVILPASRRIEGVRDKLPYQHAEKPGRFLVVPDPALTYAELVNAAFDPSKFSEFTKDNRRLVLTTDIMPRDPMSCELFEVLGSSNESETRKEIEKLKPSRVIPRFPLDPEEYYQFARSLVDPLWVGESIYLFRNDNEIVLAKKVKTSLN